MVGFPDLVLVAVVVGLEAGFVAFVVVVVGLEAGLVVGRVVVGLAAGFVVGLDAGRAAGLGAGRAAGLGAVGLGRAAGRVGVVRRDRLGFADRSEGP